MHPFRAAALAGCALACCCAAQSPPRESAAGCDAQLGRACESATRLPAGGGRIFALELGAGPGLRGRFACGDAALRLEDPLRLELVGAGRTLTLEPRGMRRSPSHVEARWSCGALELGETRLIGGSDELVDELELCNTGREPLDLELRLSSGSAVALERSSSRQQPLELGACATLAPQRGIAAFSALAPRRSVWTEAELPAAGNSAARVQTLRDASGSQALDGFGAEPGERLEWALIAPPLAEPVLRLRCATRAPRASSLAVELDGRAVAELELPPAGARARWTLAQTSLPPLDGGPLRLALVARAGTGPLCLDGFFLAEADEAAPELPPGGSFAAGLPEQLALPAGEIVRDGVRFRLPAPEPARPTLLALRGAAPGDPAQAWPLQARLAIPERHPSTAVLHLLAALALPRGAIAGRPAARFEFELDDGSRETLDWPAVPRADGPIALAGAAGERAECRAAALAGLDELALQFAWQSAPGRSLRALRVVSQGGPEVPLLLAATFEQPRESGRLPLLRARRELGGTPVELALALEDGVPLRAADGTRVLAARIVLAPGQTRRTRAVLASGENGFQVELAALDLARDARLAAREIEASERWYREHVPSLRCSDETLERAWHARWCSVRGDLRSLELPDFSLPVAYEGCCCSRHARVSPAALTLALRDLRWLHEFPAAQGSLRALLKLAAPDGIVRPVWPGGRGEPEAHELLAAVRAVHAVEGSRALLDETLELLEGDARAVRALDAPQRREPQDELEADTLQLDALVLEAGRAGPKSAARRALLDALSRSAQRILDEAGPLDSRGTGCRGLLHGAWADVLMRALAGIVPREDGRLEIDPLLEGLDGFRLERLFYRGRQLEIRWRRVGATLPEWARELPDGFTLAEGGRVLFHADAPAHWLEP